MKALFYAMASFPFRLQRVQAVKNIHIENLPGNRRGPVDSSLFSRGLVVDRFCWSSRLESVIAQV